MASLFNLNSKRIASNATEDWLSENNSTPNWRPASQDSSDGSTSRSGSSGDFDRSSSPANKHDSWSRESSPAFEVILNPDLSYRKEAARQTQEPIGALITDISSKDKESSLPPGAPSSSDVFSHENSNMEDELWDELMGGSDTEMTEPQPEQTSAPGSGNTGPGENRDEDEEDDEMLALMTDALDRELEEMQGGQQSAAEKEAAESERKNALLEEQMRVAAEKLALSKQFDSLHASSKKANAAAINRVYRRPSLHKKSGRLTSSLVYKDPRITAARRARRKASKAKALKKKRLPVSTPVTIPPEVVTFDTVAVNTTTRCMTTEVPASRSGECTASTAGTSLQSTQEPPRAYHRADMIDWRPLWERMTLTTNLDTKACLQCLGLDPVRGQEVSTRLKEYLRAPGNSVSISRQDIYSNRAKQIISQLAHNLLCDQLWGTKYFNQPHVECGYANVRFETDSTWILIEFSKLLYQIAKAEERRRNAQRRNQQKKDAKNAAKHPVISDFVTTPASHPQAVASRPVSAPQQVTANHTVASTSVRVPIGYAPTRGQYQAAVPQPVYEPTGYAPPRGLYYAPEPLLVPAPLNVSVPPQASAQHQAASTFFPAPAARGNAPPRGLHQKARQTAAPRPAAAPAVYAAPGGLFQAAVPRPVTAQNPAASITPRATTTYISPHELRRAALSGQASAPGRKTCMDFKEYMAMYGKAVRNR